MSLAQLMQGECLKLMRKIPDHSVDLILADLPYGITQNKWDVVIPFEPLWDQYRRVAKANAAIVLTATQPFSTDVVASNKAMFKYEWIWPKIAVNPLNAKRRPMQAHEHVLVFYRKQPTYNPQGLYNLRKVRSKDRRQNKSHLSDCYGKTGHAEIYTQTMGGYPTSILKVSAGARHGEHPTQKPVELMEYMIRTYTNPGDTVLDNVMGSGTTGLAAVRLGRSFIGIEMNDTYFATASRRITEHANKVRWIEGKERCTVTITKKEKPKSSKRSIKQKTVRTPRSKS